jgi:hypothetical protein
MLHYIRLRQGSLRIRIPNIHIASAHHKNMTPEKSMLRTNKMMVGNMVGNTVEKMDCE